MSLSYRLRNNQITGRLRYTPSFAKVWNRIQRFDDFNWVHYNRDSYRSEMERGQATHVTQLSAVRFDITNNHIAVSGPLDLHPAHRVIYETVMELKPNSVFECGFGGGDHLANLKLLMPSLSIAGADISEAQKDFALQRNPTLENLSLEVLDLTRAIPDHATFDLVYVNAVMMHIHGGDRHRVFLQNMLRFSRRFVIIREHWQRHNFVKDIANLFSSLDIYRIERDGVVALLLDKLNSSPYSTVTNDAQIRSS